MTFCLLSCIELTNLGYSSGVFWLHSGYAYALQLWADGREESKGRKAPTVVPSRVLAGGVGGAFGEMFVGPNPEGGGEAVQVDLGEVIERFLILYVW